MFTYQCLICGKQHSNSSPFAGEFQTKCLRCAHPFLVVREMIQPGSANGSPLQLQHAITTAVPGERIPSEQTAGAPARNNHAITPRLPEGESSEVEGKPSGKGKKAKRAPDRTKEESDEALDADDATEEEKQAAERAAQRAVAKEALAAQKKAAKPKAKGEKKPWLIIAGILVPVLLVLGGVGYFIFGRGTKAPATKSKPAAKGKSTAVAKKPPPPPKKVEEKKVEPKLPIGPPPADFVLSAPRLAAELASDPTATDRKYQGACVEVSGLFDKMETAKGLNSVPLASALFRLDRGSVVCSLGSLLPADLKRWQSLRGDQLCTVRGTYGKGGVLTKCYLMEPRAVADAKWSGKAIEMTGVVDAVLLPDKSVEFPTLRFAGETNTPVMIECLFKKTDLDAVKQIPAGSSVILKGVCGNGRVEATRTVVPIHNCELISTTGPAQSVPRLVPADLARDFGEDSRPYFLPARGKEEKVGTPLTVTQLSHEWKAGGKNLDKYLYRLVTVSGRLKTKANGLLILESPETDQLLKVSCQFRKEIFRELADLADFTIQGLCTGKEGLQTLRLDNCVVDASQLRKTVPRVTADYLPHKPGRTVIYDLATFPPAVKFAVVERQMWYQREGGFTETVVTHAARFAGKSLLSPDKAENWTASGAKKTLLKGPVFSQKNTPGMIEFGQRIVLPKGTHVVQEPVLKPGAKAGDSWEWVQENSKHIYTLERFDKWLARPCVIVKEVIVTPLAKFTEREVRHVYVQGVGEVERQEWVSITSTEKKLVQEKKMVFIDDARVAPLPPKDAKAK